MTKSGGVSISGYASDLIGQPSPSCEQLCPCLLRRWLGRPWLAADGANLGPAAVPTALALLNLTKELALVMAWRDLTSGMPLVESAQPSPSCEQPGWPPRALAS
jgi:hypothetical protein